MRGASRQNRDAFYVHLPFTPPKGCPVVFNLFFPVDFPLRFTVYLPSRRMKEKNPRSNFRGTWGDGLDRDRNFWFIRLPRTPRRRNSCVQSSIHVRIIWTVLRSNIDILLRSRKRYNYIITEVHKNELSFLQ